MAGIYIHIPFCKQKCHYCNFYSTVSFKYKDEFLKILEHEIIQQKQYLNDQEIQTIYFGGGTPSMLSRLEIENIIRQLNQNFKIHKNAEYTLEVNPDDLTKEKSKELFDSGINRLSIGTQSFDDEDLKYLNRVHDAKHARFAIEGALKVGFTNLTIDLIYGIPTLSAKKWRKNLQIFFDYKLPHLSAYALTVEPKTALDVLIAKRKIEGINEQLMVEHFEILLEQIKMNDFIHYEISNFSKAGFYSKHNSLYWLGGNYLGLGPSAHSFNGSSRQWNHASLKKYLEFDELKTIIFEKEILSINQKYNEYVMTSIRTSWGCNLEHIANVFGHKYQTHCLKSAQSHLDSQKLELRKNILLLTNNGKLFADGITADLFVDL
jgi:oxygen-independent coproporphyrinogen III oxidase